MKFKFFLPVIFTLFVSSFAFAQDVPIDASQVKGYMLGPGDEITGKVSGEKDYDFLVTVNEDGKIEVPFFDKPIVAKCRTENELKIALTNILKKELRNPQLSLHTERKSRSPASIYGEVNSPQQLILMRKVTLIEMIAFAGGLREEAGGMVQVFRPQMPMCSTDANDTNWKTAGDPADMPSKIYALANVKGGKEDSNPVIYPGDVIVIQKALPVYITGEVLAPQGIYIKEGGTSLTEAIAKIGGVRREAKTKDIKIYRVKGESTDREIITANYDQIKKGLQKDIMLKPYDIVEVDKTKESIASIILRTALGAAKQSISSGASNIGYRVIY